MKDRIYIADKGRAVAVFKMTGVSAEADLQTWNSLLRSVTVTSKGPARYGVEVLLRSERCEDTVTGKKLEAYISLIQSAQYGVDMDRLQRKMDVVESILIRSGYEGVWIMKEDIASLHTSLLSSGMIGITCDPKRKVAGDVDSVADALVRYAADESEAFSIVAYGSGDNVRVNTVVLAASEARVPVLAKAFNSELMTCSRELSDNRKGYLAVRMSCVNKRYNSSCKWESIPSLLPTSRTESLATWLPVQPQVLGKDFIENQDGIYIGTLPSGRKLTIPVKTFHSSAIVGRPGYGKSYLLGHLVKTLGQMNQHVVVLDLIDSDFRSLAKDLNAPVFAQDRGDTSLQLNPFRVKGFTVKENQKLCTDFLLSALSLFAPQDTFLRDTICDYFSSRNEARGIWDFIQYFEQNFKRLNNYAAEMQSNHIGALKSRLRKLQSCISDREFDPEMILRNNAIIELENVDSKEDKAIILLFLIHVLIMIKRKEAKSGIVKPTFLVIDEMAELLNGKLNDTDVGGMSLRDMLLKVILTCRKVGLYLVTATQDFQAVEPYFAQSHLRILLNSKYCKEMGEEFSHYQQMLPKLKVGQCVLEMSEFSQPLLFQTPEFSFGYKLSDEEVSAYMRERFPEYVASSIKPYDVAVSVMSYIVTQLSELKGNELEIWKPNFNVRDFVTKVLTSAGKPEILEDVLVEIRKKHVALGGSELFDLKLS